MDLIVILPFNCNAETLAYQTSCYVSEDRKHFFALRRIIYYRTAFITKFENIQTVWYKMSPPLAVEVPKSYTGSEKASYPKNENNQTIKLDDALELIGFGRAQVEIVLLSGVTIMATICETMGISVILPASKCDIPISTGNQGLLSGATFLGIVLSSYVWGYLSDTQGRRKMMQYGLYATGVIAVLSSFANDFASLLVLRLIAGVW